MNTFLSHFVQLFIESQSTSMWGHSIGNASPDQTPSLFPSFPGSLLTTFSFSRVTCCVRTRCAPLREREDTFLREVAESAPVKTEWREPRICARATLWMRYTCTSRLVSRVEDVHSQQTFPPPRAELSECPHFPFHPVPQTN